MMQMQAIKDFTLMRADGTAQEVKYGEIVSVSDEYGVRVLSGGYVQEVSEGEETDFNQFLVNVRIRTTTSNPIEIQYVGLSIDGSGLGFREDRVEQSVKNYRVFPHACILLIPGNDSDHIEFSEEPTMFEYRECSELRTPGTLDKGRRGVVILPLENAEAGYGGVITVNSVRNS